MLEYKNVKLNDDDLDLIYSVLEFYYFRTKDDSEKAHIDDLMARIAYFYLTDVVKR